MSEKKDGAKDEPQKRTPNQYVKIHFLFFVCHSSFIIHHSSFITHHSSLIINRELRYFIVQGSEEKVRELQQQGADVNAPDEGEDPSTLNQNSQVLEQVAPKVTLDTPLHLAAETNQVKIISQLFYLGAKMENHNR